MSDDKSKVSDKASEIARNIWLAGVGAYGRAVDEAQGRLEKAGVETPKLFRELVKAGAALEDDARSALSAGQDARSSVEERISRVRENFNLQRLGRGDELMALHDKIDRLTAKVDDLSNALDARGVAAGNKKRPVRKKAAAKRAPASKKTPAKKNPPPRNKAATKHTASGTRRS